MAHTTDVDGMLAGMTNQQFDEWCAKDLIEPIGTEKLCHTVARVGVMIGAMMGQELTEADFMPWNKERDERREDAETLTPRQSAAAISAHFAMLTGGLR